MSDYPNMPQCDDYLSIRKTMPMIYNQGANRVWFQTQSGVVMVPVVSTSSSTSSQKITSRVDPQPQIITNRKELKDRLIAIFALAQSEDLEDGEVGPFREELTDFLNINDSAGIDVFHEYITQHIGDPKEAPVLGYALKLLGYLDNDRTVEKRRVILERFVQNPSLKLRFGAAHGLISMKSRRSLPVLTIAAQNESCVPLKKLLDRSLSKLLG